MLPEELMRQVRQLQIYTRRAVNEDFAGEYTSAFKGRGMEFSEVREYQPGDDVRFIDWNVTARTGTPFVKKFVEERELTVIFAVDLSASGKFGSTKRIKNKTAAELCAVLAFTATRNNDKVGLLIFTDQAELYIPPKKGSRHVLRLIRELLDFEPARTGTDIVGALQFLSQIMKRKSVIFLVSDFLTPETVLINSRQTVNNNSSSNTSRFDTAIRLLNRRHDLIAVRVRDQREITLPRAGIIELVDAETGERALLDTGSTRVRRDYARWAQAADHALENKMRRFGIDQIQITTGEPYIHSLVNLFHQRERRR